MYKKRQLEVFSHNKIVDHDNHKSGVNSLLTKYEQGIPVFMDRNYSDSKENIFLREYLLIQVKRHPVDSIRIKINQDCSILRLTSKEKHLEILKGWNKLNKNILVKGWSTNLTELYSKDYPKGTIVLIAGENQTGSPILIKAKNNDKPIEVILLR